MLPTPLSTPINPSLLQNASRTLVLASRHAEFYFPDGTVIFKAADHERAVLYCVYMGLLSRRSKFFDSLFSLPRNPNETTLAISCEGKDDQHPIELPPKIQPASFDDLCTYLFLGPSQCPSNERFLINILDLSTFLEIEDGINFAIDELEKRDDFHPALQFELARLFRVDQWIEPSFRKLIASPISTLTLDQHSQIGQIGIFYLLRTKDQIDVLHKSLALLAPPVQHGVMCGTHLRCATSWEIQWDKLGKHLVHPDHVLRGKDIVDQLNTVKIPEMGSDCQQLTITGILERGVVTKDEEYISEAVKQLMSSQTDEPIRAAMHSAADP